MKKTKIIFTTALILVVLVANAQFSYFLEKENLGFSAKGIAEKGYKTCEFNTEVKYYEEEDYVDKGIIERFDFDPKTGLIKSYIYNPDGDEVSFSEMVTDDASMPAFHGIHEETNKAKFTWEDGVISKIEIIDMIARKKEYTNTISSGKITQQTTVFDGDDDYSATELKYNENGQLTSRQRGSDFEKYEYPSNNEIVVKKGEGKVKKGKIKGDVKEIIHEYYNTDGKITKQVFSNDNRISGTVEESYTRTYEYDKLGRLIKYSETPSDAARKAHYTVSWSIHSITILTYTYIGESLLPIEFIETIDFNTDPGINRFYKISLLYNEF